MHFISQKLLVNHIISNFILSKRVDMEHKHTYHNSDELWFLKKMRIKCGCVVSLCKGEKKNEVAL